MSMGFDRSRGFNTKTFLLADQYGNTSAIQDHQHDEKFTTVPLDTMLFRKDRYCIPDIPYQEVAIAGSGARPLLHAMQ